MQWQCQKQGGLPESWKNLNLSAKHLTNKRAQAGDEISVCIQVIQTKVHLW